jgi:hypothetical protein
VSESALLTSKNTSAIQFTSPVSEVLIGVSWLLLFNTGRAKDCFSRR